MTGSRNNIAGTSIYCLEKDKKEEGSRCGKPCAKHIIHTCQKP